MSTIGSHQLTKGKKIEKKKFEGVYALIGSVMFISTH